MKKINLKSVLFGFILAALVLSLVSATGKSYEPANGTCKYEGGSVSGIIWILNKETGKLKAVEPLTKNIYVFDYETETLTKSKINGN